MMQVWVMNGSYEGEYFSSVHLTEKGCALACIFDVFDFLGIEDEKSALQVMNHCYEYTETDGEQKEPFEWDTVKLKEMTRQELWKVFHNWTDVCWRHMSDRCYYIDARPQTIQA
tara:strand:- start:1493 stop:1834 length:342 start_codon:yes stop_codon:yes gene_type:complete